MSAIDKTKALVRKDLPVDWLIANEHNPNKMSNREFDLLCDNINAVGITDPIIVRKVGKKQYRIIGGHHRAEAARHLQFSEVPCTIVTDPEFDEDMENFQLMRHNAIKGKIDPQKFVEMYRQYAGKYEDDVIQELFGYADEDEFKKLIDQTARSLPKEMQKGFKEAAEEIKTIDELSNLLNRMFTLYGDTLPYGYMVVDYGGKKSYWLRVNSKTMKALDVLGEICIKEQRTVDDILGSIVQSIAKGTLPKLLKKIVKNTVPVDLPPDLAVKPTHDNLDKIKSL